MGVVTCDLIFMAFLMKDLGGLKTLVETPKDACGHNNALQGPHHQRIQV